MFVVIMGTLLIGVGGGALVTLFARRPLNVPKKALVQVVSAVVFFVASYLGIMVGSL